MTKRYTTDVTVNLTKNTVEYGETKEEFKCEVCGKFIAEDEGITLHDGSWVCDNMECRGELDEENQPIKKRIQ